MADPVKRPGGIQSVEIAAKLMEIVIGAAVPVRLTDVAASAGMTPSKVRPYLVSLIRAGLVSQDPQSRAYDLGGRIVSWGAVALRRDRDFLFAQSAVLEIGDAYGDPVLLTMWQDDRPIIVLSHHNDTLPMSFRPGGATALDTATGRVFAAFRPIAPDQMANGIPDRARRTQFVSDVEGVRRDGHARADRVVLRDGVTISGYAVLAAPIFSAERRLSYVLTILYPKGISAAARRERLRALLRVTGASGVTSG